MKNQPDRVAAAMHPVRMRIMGILYRGNRSPKEIRAELAEVPTGSVYRHLKILEQAELIEVVEVRGEPGAEYNVYGTVRKTQFFTPEERKKIDGASFVDLISMLTAVVQEHAQNYVTTNPQPAITERVGAFVKPALLTDDEINEIREIMKRAATSSERNPSPELRSQLLGFFMFPNEKKSDA